MKNIFKKIYFHPLYFICAFIVILTGNFNSFITLFILILFHELGHVLVAYILKWKIDKIVILPYGMITIFKDNLNKSIIEEFLILIMGPIFQIVYNYFFPNPYHELILFLNLLPIYPLDGSKFIFLFFNKFISYYSSYIYIYTISIISIIMVLIYKHDFLIILMLLYLSYNLIKNIYLLKYTIISFLFDRYKNKLRFNKTLKIKNINKMRREYYHYFLINKKYEEEYLILRKMFDKS